MGCICSVSIHRMTLVVVKLSSSGSVASAMVSFSSSSRSDGSQNSLKKTTCVVCTHAIHMQLAASKHQKLEELRKFIPDARPEDWGYAS